MTIASQIQPIQPKMMYISLIVVVAVVFFAHATRLTCAFCRVPHRGQ
jgi:hypothetical protein